MIRKHPGKCFLGAAVALLFTFTEPSLPAQSVDKGDGFTLHGVGAEVSRSRGAAVVEAAGGEPRLAVWLQDHTGGYGLLMIDPDTGETTFHEMPFESSSGWIAPFTFLYSREGFLYTHFEYKFVEFDPRRGEYTHIEQTEDHLAMWTTEDDDGVIWMGTYPNAHIISFNPRTREYRDYGAINEENWPQYPRRVATDDAGWVYTHIGMTHNHMFALNPETGEVRPMVDEDDRAGGDVVMWRGEDGKVYGRMPTPEAPWLQMYEGRAVEIEGSPEVAAVVEISDRQEGVFGALPDGREITRLNVPGGWMRVADPEGRERRVSFDYPSHGAWIYSLEIGPDERIYGSTGHPLHLFAYDPSDDTFWDTPVRGGHINAMTVLGDRLYGAIYTQGLLISYDPDRDTEYNVNPGTLAASGATIDRPHVILAHSDGRHIIQAGTPGYGLTGGGIMVYDTESGDKVMYQHTDLIEYHSTMALAELPDGNLIGGTTTSPGTGGERIARECTLYILEWPSMEIEYQENILPSVREIRELLTGPDGLVYGLDVEGTFFVFDWEAREVIHRESLADAYGNITGGQAPRVWSLGPDDHLYVLFRNAIVRIETGTFRHEKLAVPPVEARIGVALHEGRLYFAQGSELWSYRLP